MIETNKVHMQFEQPAYDNINVSSSASKYKEDMSRHFMYGDNERIAKHMKDYGDKA